MFGLHWKLNFLCVWHFFCGSHTLFMGSTSTEFCKKKIKTKSHGTIHTFKNYFATIFLVINFQFLAISDIQTDPLECFLGTFITSDWIVGLTSCSLLFDILLNSCLTGCKLAWVNWSSPTFHVKLLLPITQI